MPASLNQPSFTSQYNLAQNSLRSQFCDTKVAAIDYSLIDLFRVLCSYIELITVFTARKTLHNTIKIRIFHNENQKRFVAVGAAVTLTLSAAAMAAAPAFINILTGGTSGVYYPIGVALSQLYGTGIEGSKTSVQATKASVENLNLLQAGRGELAFALGDSVAAAYQGDIDAGFKTPLDKIRVLASAYPNYIQIVANKESGIKTLADLKENASQWVPLNQGQNSMPDRFSRLRD